MGSSSYDFDEVIDRRDTDAVKWEFFKQGDQFLPIGELPPDPEGRPLLPMWVADMDFRCPQPVIDSLIARARHGIFGYTMPGEGYRQAVVGWMARRQGWRIEPEWIVPSPGVVPALNLLVRAFVKPGERVIIQPPVYYPFYGAVENQGAEVVRNPLILGDEGRYHMDFAGLEALASQPDVTLLILCSPHNPVGRVWAAEELRRLGDICQAHGVQVISDEIHGDLILPGERFTPYASLGDAFLQQSITCTAPSKSFNLAGLATSNLIIPDPELRGHFQKEIARTGLHGANLFGAVAMEAAYSHGDAWLDALLDYVAGNLATLRTFLATYLPQIRLIEPQGTYLVWLDCRALGLDKEALERLMFDQARLFLDEGYIFGPEGEGFERVNIACPRAILEETLERMHAAIQAL